MDRMQIRWQNAKMRALIFILFATTAHAESPMTAAEFEAYVSGRILSFSDAQSQDYGVEQYLPNRRVRWSALDGECTKGEWYPDAGNICFIYVDDPEPKCWEVFETPNGLRVENRTSGLGTVLFESGDSATALICGNLFS
jgi:hypothetical protein